MYNPIHTYTTSINIPNEFNIIRHSTVLEKEAEDNAEDIISDITDQTTTNQTIANQTDDKKQQKKDKRNKQTEQGKNSNGIMLFLPQITKNYQLEEYHKMP